MVYTTSTSTTPNVISRTNRIKFLLDAKKVAYEEVDLTMQPHRRGMMLDASEGNPTLPQVHVNGKVSERMHGRKQRLQV